MHAPSEEFQDSALDAISKIVQKHAGRSALLGRCQSGRPLEADYDITHEVLGTGVNGGVRVATRRDLPSQRVAVKCLAMDGVSTRKRNSMLTEVAIQMCMDHPHIARIVDVYEAKAGKSLEIAMECLEGGELFHRVNKMKSFPEASAAKITRQVLGAIAYMHSQEVAHRDLKLENIMFTSRSSNHLKLIDFGLSKLCRDRSKRMKTHCGTLSYIAPEVLGRGYTKQCDMWSLGVIVFILLSGHMPFYGGDEQQIEKIKQGHYSMKVEEWQHISAEGMDFVRCLLNLDANLRLTAKQALQHPWLSTRYPEPSPSLSSLVLTSLGSHVTGPNLRQYCRKLVAQMLPSTDQTWAAELFDALDTSQTGKVLLADCLKKFDASHEVHKSLPSLDGLKDCEIKFSDFLAALIPLQPDASDELVNAIFRRFDSEKAGYITWSQLRSGCEDSCEDSKENVQVFEWPQGCGDRVSASEFRDYIHGVPQSLPRPVTSRPTFEGERTDSLSEVEKPDRFSRNRVHFNSESQPDKSNLVPMILPGVPQKRGNLRATVRGADWSPGIDGNEYPVLLRRRADMQQCSGCKGDVSTPFVSTGVTPCCKSPAFFRGGLSPLGLISPDASSRAAPDPCTCTLM